MKLISLTPCCCIGLSPYADSLVMSLLNPERELPSLSNSDGFNILKILSDIILAIAPHFPFKSHCLVMSSLSAIIVDMQWDIMCNVAGLFVERQMAVMWNDCIPLCISGYIYTYIHTYIQADSCIPDTESQTHLHACLHRNMHTTYIHLCLQTKILAEFRIFIFPDFQYFLKYGNSRNTEIWIWKFQKLEILETLNYKFMFVFRQKCMNCMHVLKYEIWKSRTPNIHECWKYGHPEIWKYGNPGILELCICRQICTSLYVSVYVCM